MGARYYDGDTGRFTSQDPVSQQSPETFQLDPQQFNMYSYARSNPLRRVDPDGRASVDADIQRIKNEYIVDQIQSIQSSLQQLSQTISNIALTAADFTQVGDISVLTTGQSLTGQTASIFDYGIAIAGLAGGPIGKIGGKVLDVAKVKKVDLPYVRPSNATTLEQRQSVQGLPCIDCGKVDSPNVADHITPLVVEYYQTGTIDTDFMRSIDAVQPQCRNCSASQGGFLANYSRIVKDFLGL